MSEAPQVELRSGDAVATISLLGAEPLVWRIGERSLLWHGDPAHWSFRAPILFPIVGASSGGVIRVGGDTYPMPQHGFARLSEFRLIEAEPERALLRLSESEATRGHYPFAFSLDVEVALSSTRLALTFQVTNTGENEMPYALGFHPAFPWLFAGGERSDYRVLFEAAESDRVPGVSEGALLIPDGRRVPLEGRTLPLEPEMFTEALVFLDARSRSLLFQGPSGEAIEMAVEGFPHLAIWSRPTAPFLSLEAWTGHADWEGASGELAARSSMILLAAGETKRHKVTLAWTRG